MNEPIYFKHDCDLCGSSDAADIEVLRAYTGEKPIHVCKSCGFVYVRERRSPEAIANSWSNEMFGANYTARIPAVKARQTYVAEFLDMNVPLRGKALCDIGGGEGQFLEIIGSNEYGAKPYGIEPSPANCEIMAKNNIECFTGTIEDFLVSDQKSRRFDVVTIMWTLENCNSCNAMIKAAYDLLKVGGHICIATGSRILTPFKKPLHQYVPKGPVDTHCFRFSANTIRGFLAKHGFQPKHINRYIDTDLMMVIGQKTDGAGDIPWNGDDWQEVIDFFNRWDKESREHYPSDAIFD